MPNAPAVLRAGLIALLGIVALVFSVAAMAEVRAAYGDDADLREGFCRVSWDDGAEWLLSGLTLAEPGEPTLPLESDAHSRCASPEPLADGELYWAKTAGDARTGDCPEELTTSGNCAYVRVADGVLSDLYLGDGTEGLAVWSEFPMAHRIPLVRMLAGPLFYLLPVLIIFGFGLAAWQEWDG